MVEALAKVSNSEELKRGYLTKAGLATEAEERRSNEAFHTNQIIIKLPTDSSETKCSISLSTHLAKTS